MTMTYAIVLGATVGPDGSASPTLRRRAERAAELVLSGKADALVATGGAGAGSASEAQAAAGVATALGVPQGAILCEERSRTTRENIAGALAMLPAGAGMILVSDAWHLPRARLIARRLGHPAQAVAASAQGTRLRGTVKHLLREALALAWEILRPARGLGPRG